jgi:hypothetical protein
MRACLSFTYESASFPCGVLSAFAFTFGIPPTFWRSVSPVPILGALETVLTICFALAIVPRLVRFGVLRQVPVGEYCGNACTFCIGYDPVLFVAICHLARAGSVAPTDSVSSTLFGHVCDLLSGWSFGGMVLLFRGPGLLVLYVC